MTAAKVSSTVTAALFSKAVRLSRAATEGPKVGEVNTLSSLCLHSMLHCDVVACAHSIHCLVH
jgi:hypothetical protein